MQPENHPLEIRALNKFYGNFQAVKSVNFNLIKGEIFGLLGPNGAGKTSIISTVTTLEKPTSGQVLVFGQDVTLSPMQTKAQIGVVHQEIISSGFFDVEEILEFQSGYYGITHNTERIQYLLNELGLFEHRKKKVKQLSGGMKRRLMIAKALVHNPKLLLLDEPTAGVDINLREKLWSFVKKLQSEGMTVLLTTHYLEEAEQLCGRVGIINKGKLEIIDSTLKIIENFSSKVIELTLSSKLPESSMGKIAKLISAASADHQGYTYQFEVSQKETLGELMSRQNIALESMLDIKILEGSLEQGFLKILSQKPADL